MTTFKDWFIFFAGVALLVCRTGLSQGFSFRLTPEKIQAGESAVLELRLSPAITDHEVVVYDELLRNMKTLKVLDYTSSLEENTWVWTYRLTSYQPGTISLPPVEVIQGPTSYSTEIVSFTTTTQREEGDSEIRPAFGTLRLPILWLPYVWKVLLLLFGLGAFYSIYLWLGKRRRPRPILLPPPMEMAPEDPLVWLNRELEKIKEEVARGRLPEKNLDRFTFVLRSYCSRTSQMPVTSWTTRECEYLLGDSSQASTLLEIFRHCDHYKFQKTSRETLSSWLLQAISQSQQVLNV